MINTPKFEIKLDTRREDRKGQYPVVLYIYFAGKKRLIPIGMNLDENEFRNATKNKPLIEFEARKQKIDSFEDKARTIVESLGTDFSLELFSAKWIEKEKSQTVTVKDCFSEYVEKLRKEHRIATAISYEQACRSISKFHPDIKLKDVTKDFLKNYDLWMMNEGNRKTTIGIYLRSLRAVINYAIDQKIITKDNYPFGKRAYVIPKGHNIKKALSKTDIEKIKNFKSEDPSLMKASSFWLFMYFGKGLNPKDVCKLKNENISGNTIHFIRSKTERINQGDPIVIRLPLNEKMLEVIKTYGTEGKPEEYIFPMLKSAKTPEREYELKQNFVRWLNDKMNDIAELLGIQANITTYTARHSFSTALRNAGSSTEFISESLGHKDIKTTQNYLGEFETDAERIELDKL